MLELAFGERQNLGRILARTTMPVRHGGGGRRACAAPRYAVRLLQRVHGISEIIAPRYPEHGDLLCRSRTEGSHQASHRADFSRPIFGSRRAKRMETLRHYFHRFDTVLAVLIVLAAVWFIRDRWRNRIRAPHLRLPIADCRLTIEKVVCQPLPCLSARHGGAIGNRKSAMRSLSGRFRQIGSRGRWSSVVMARDMSFDDVLNQHVELLVRAFLSARDLPHFRS